MYVFKMSLYYIALVDQQYEQSGIWSRIRTICFKENIFHLPET